MAEVILIFPLMFCTYMIWDMLRSIRDELRELNRKRK